MGLAAPGVRQVERRPELKRYASHALYFVAAVDTALRHYDRSRPRLSGHYADGTVVDGGHTPLALNTRPYPSPGPRPIVLSPSSALDRPLAVLTIRTLAAPTVVGL